jgi:hypothetical protein
VTPAVVDTRDDTHLVITGQHLAPRVTVDLDRPSRSVVDQVFTATLEGPATVALADVAWVSTEQLGAELVSGAAPGVYRLHLVDPAGGEAWLEGAVEVVDGPALVDAGQDGGPTDAGSGDAGSDDAGAPDAGPCLTLTWADLDQDSFGGGDAGYVCAPGRVLVGGDCNDADPLTSPSGLEVCNGVDDDCDGLVDEGVCPADAGWSRRTDTGGASSDWATTWSWSRGALVIAGQSQALVRRDGGAFVSAAAGCPSNLVSSWAAPDGLAWVGGGASGNGQGRVAALSPDASTPSCGAASQASDPVVGVVGFPVADGGLELVGALRSGRVARWSPGRPLVETASNLPGTTRLEDLHGVDPQNLYAVGSDTEDNGRMKVFRMGGDGGWVDERISALPGSQVGALHGVWVLAPGVAVVAGDDGLVALERGGAWARLDGLDAGATVRSVRAFGVGRVYAVTTDGQVLRWNGAAWSVVYDNGARVPWFDITGLTEDDLWVVGRSGFVAHWPN